MAPEAKHIVVAVTGASGAAYARSLIGHLTGSEANVHTHLIVSPHGKMLLADELGIRRITPETLAVNAPQRLTVHSYQDVGCELASGSFPVDGMVICPCSSNTLGAIAAGLGDNLITRAAHV
ncbi:MAG: hypothetical protein JXA69_21475, partial [Phycisphaerae bacterium]|nr:hypothetical protein [Phycisphaerae bacterium]